MKQTVSKKFYVLAIGGGVGASHLLAIAGMLMSRWEVSLLVPLSILPMSFAGIVLAVLAYSAWGSIQDGHARMTPSSAILRLFIPLYNVYWFFQVWWGFAQDYNEYLDRHDLDVSKISEGVYLAFAGWNLAVAGFAGLIQISHQSWILAGGLFVLEMVLGLGHTILSVLMVMSTCDAMNALSAQGKRPGIA